MELPDIGIHCSSESCRSLDFLPVTCFFCKKPYCSLHAKSHPTTEADGNIPFSQVINDGHYCSQHPVDARALVCPLCDQIIPKSNGAEPNETIDLHIRSGCSKPKETKIFSNLCNVKNCNKKELVPITCHSYSFSELDVNSRFVSNTGLKETTNVYRSLGV